ncbi:MAG: hypothetical protein KBE14_10270 [Ottowia sp.]|jgi:hypothetical protein|nr:hypothetical protein [Ottowia sp.]HPU11942.1 hypothetical protein [Ottowia sp.]HRL31370.1 hypothetical protein [Ottowia sp.]HRL66871.1 hypothetical protein [Ottowia sp.]
MAQQPDEAAFPSAASLDADIVRCIWGYENGGSSQGRKSFFKRLVWLEAQREQLFGLAAPRRAFR